MLLKTKTRNWMVRIIEGYPVEKKERTTMEKKDCFVFHGTNP